MIPSKQFVERELSRLVDSCKGEAGYLLFVCEEEAEELAFSSSSSPFGDFLAGRTGRWPSCEIVKKAKKDKKANHLKLAIERP